MATPQIPKFGLAFDTETTGYSIPNYAEKHQAISFGLIVFDVATFEPVEEDYFLVKYNPAKYEWSETAAKIHGLTPEYLNANGLSQEDAAVRFFSLVLKYFATEDVMALGHRVNFDIAFANQLADIIQIQPNWHPVKIDSCALGSALLGISKSDDLFKELGFEDRGVHNALEDIRYTLTAVSLMQKVFQEGWKSLK